MAEIKKIVLIPAAVFHGGFVATLRSSAEYMASMKTPQSGNRIISAATPGMTTGYSFNS
jgi:hypothetical protein